MEVRDIFEHISKSEGILIDDVAKNLGVAKSTLYYSVKKNELSHKLKKALKEIYPDYYELILSKKAKNIENEMEYIAEYVIKNEDKLIKENSKFRLWLKTKVQDGVIEMLSVKKS